MCAAPAGAYRAWKAHDGTTTANSIKADVAIPNASEAVLKSRFYLDHFYSSGVGGASSNIDPATTGFIGGCVVGSDNYYMHAEARRWTMRIRHPSSGQQIQLFNDAGLNTLGKAEIGPLGISSLWANYIRANLTFKAAWYVNTTQFGFEYKKPSDSSWVRVPLNPPASIPQQQTITDTWRLPGSMTPNTDYQLRFYNINAEGTYLSPPFPITTDEYIYEEIFEVRTSPCTLSLTKLKLYFSSDTRATMSTLTGTPVTADLYAWDDDTFSTNPATGWYYSHDDGYSYYYDSNFGFTHRQFCTPVPTIKVSISITIFESGVWTATAQNITGSNFSSPVTITGVAVGSNGGSPVANVSFSVTIPASQPSGSNSGTHTADFVSMLDWTAGGFTSSNPGVVANSEINGFVGIG